MSAGQGMSAGDMKLETENEKGVYLTNILF